MTDISEMVIANVSQKPESGMFGDFYGLTHQSY